MANSKRRKQDGQRKLRLEPLETRYLMAGNVLTGSSFTEVAAAAGLSGANGFGLDASWVDYNGDGLVDLWIGPHQNNLPSDHGLPRPDPHLYKNLGNGKFQDVYKDLFPDTMPDFDLHGALWFDYDNDGDLDLVQCVGGNRGVVHETTNHLNRVFVQDQGQFRLVSFASGLSDSIARGREAEELDINNDGLPDVFLSDFVRADGASTSKLYTQTARGFEPLATAAPFNFQGVDVISSEYNDVTGDGKSDLVVLDSDANLHIYSRLAGTPIQFQQNDNLIPTINAQVSVRDFVIGDFNNDGKNDIVEVRRDGNIARVDLLLFNTATGKFEDRNLLDAQSKQIVGGSITLGDYNNDQSLDLYVSCEYGTTDAPDYLLMNKGDGTFTVTRVPATNGTVTTDHGLGRKAITADYNKDGALDVFLNSTGDVGSAPRLLMNPGNTNRWLNIDLEGVVSARDAVGARVTVVAGGVTQTKFQTTGKHHFAQDDSLLHFGLGTNKVIDSIKVVWPSGRTSILTNVSTNKTLKIQENLATSRGNARTIPVTLNAGSYSDTIISVGTSRYYRFAVADSGLLQINLTGANTVVRLEDAAGNIKLEASSVTSPVPLDKGTYFLSVRNNGAGPVSFNLKPVWTIKADILGPKVEELVLDDAINTQGPGITALLNDGLYGGANVASAKMWIDTIGGVNSGYALTAVDGAFDNVAELLAGTIPSNVYAALPDGPHTIYVRGVDSLNNLGLLSSIVMTKITTANPVVNLNQSVAFMSASPRILAPGAVVSDADTTNFAGATLLVSMTNARLGDRFDVNYDNTILKSPISYNEDRLYYNGKLVARAWGGWQEDTIATFHLEPLVIKFTSDATLDAVNAILNRIRFQNDGSSVLPIADRTISFLLTDGSGGRTTVTEILRDPNYSPGP